jgi:hypothetical protein
MPQWSLLQPEMISLNSSACNTGGVQRHTQWLLLKIGCVVMERRCLNFNAMHQLAI